MLSHVLLFATPWTIAHQAPLSMEFSRQEYWSGLSFLSPADLPNPGLDSCLLNWQADSLPLNHLRSPILLVTNTKSNVYLAIKLYLFYLIRSSQLSLLCFSIGLQIIIRASSVAQLVKNLPAVQETQVQSLGWEDPLKKEILAWKIP